MQTINPMTAGKQQYLDEVLAPLVGGIIKSVKSHRLVVACTDGVERNVAIQSDSAGNNRAHVEGLIPMFRGARVGSLAALESMRITSAGALMDEGECGIDAFPHFTYELAEGHTGDPFSLRVYHDRNANGGFVHVWDKGTKAPSSAR